MIMKSYVLDIWINFCSDDSLPIYSLHGLIDKSLCYADDEQTTAGERAVLHEEGLETAKKIQLLKDKISSNISMIPTVLKRMKDCISTIDNLDSCNVVIHPAFKRKKN